RSNLPRPSVAPPRPEPACNQKSCLPTRGADATPLALGRNFSLNPQSPDFGLPVRVNSYFSRKRSGRTYHRSAAARRHPSCASASSRGHCILPSEKVEQALRYPYLLKMFHLAQMNSGVLLAERSKQPIDQSIRLT